LTEAAQLLEKADYVETLTLPVRVIFDIRYKHEVYRSLDLIDDIHEYQILSDTTIIMREDLECFAFNQKYLCPGFPFYFYWSLRYKHPYLLQFGKQKFSIIAPLDFTKKNEERSDEKS